MVEKKTNETYNVLIVDDDEGLTNLIQKRLKRAGFHSLIASTGAEAIKQVVDNQDNILMILDFKLPDMTGEQIINTLNERRCSVPFITMTGHGDEKTAVKMMKLGAHDYLLKDAGILDLLPEIVKRVIDRLIADKRLTEVEKQLHGSTEFYGSIIESMSDGILALDKDFHYTHWNPAMEKIFKVKKENIVGTNKLPWEIFPHLKEHSVDGMMKQAMRGNVMVRENIPYCLSDGTEGFTSETFFPMRTPTGEISGIVGVVREVTEKRQNEEKIRKLSSAVEQSPNILIITDVKGVIEYVNPRFNRITGFTDQEAIGKDPSIAKSGRHSHGFYEEMWKTIASGKEWRGEICNKKKNGDLYWEFASISSIKNEEGVITHFIKVAEDITNRKMSEDRLLQSEKLKALGVMSSGIAHDFNNILAIIHGNAQLLESHYKEDVELREGLVTILKAAQDGAETVRRMFEFTKTKSGSSQYVPLDIVDLIKQVIDFSKYKWKNIAELKGDNYDINIDNLGPVPNVQGNASSLREVFVNIINNALDAMPGGGSLSFQSSIDGDAVVVSIADTGLGMTEDVQKKLFDPFFTTKGGKGSGLGMSVVYGIIVRHGGKIEVESQVGKGSIFKLRLPIAKEEIKPIVPTGPVKKEKTVDYRILVVDDIQEINKMLKAYLSREGYSVKCLDNGTEAIETLKKEDFDLVLCDLGMPGISGLDMINSIKKLNKNLKMGVITGWADIVETINKEKDGVDFAVSKPIDFQRLSVLIREALGA